MKKHLFYTLLMLISLTGCSSPKGNADTEKVEEGLPVINLSEGVEEVDKLNLSDAAERVEIVKLETTGQSLISDIEHIQVTNSDIWITHYKDQYVYRFSRDGKFKNRVGKIGQGPEEYTRLSSFWIDESSKEVYILSSVYGVKVYDYEGHYIRTLTNKKMDDMFTAEPSTNNPIISYKGLFLLCQNLAVSRDTEESLWSLALVDANFNKQKFFKNPAYIGREEQIIANGAGGSMLQWREMPVSTDYYNDDLTFKFADTDTIYYFDTTKKDLIPQYAIYTNEDKGDYGLTHESLRKRNAFSYFTLTGYYPTKDYIYLRGYKGETIYIYRYSKKDSSVQLVKRETGLRERNILNTKSYSLVDNAFVLNNDICGGKFTFNYRCSGKYWIQELDPDSSTYDKFLEELRRSPDVPQKQQLLDVIARTGEEDNPILLIAVLK
ncbi:MAG: 6-bladed beta-propeller [Bacteroidaceae bacterium]|nr:6-bladed beta-propeller [Bacteroidaceae bacterium]